MTDLAVNYWCITATVLNLFWFLYFHWSIKHLHYSGPLVTDKSQADNSADCNYLLVALITFKI